MTKLTITLPNVDDEVSKANEIKTIKELHLFFENRNLYLASFFRPELVDWAVTAIEHDVAPDIWADRMHHIEVADERRAKVHKLRAELEVLHDEVQTRDENADEYNIARDERIKGMVDTLETMEHINDSLREDVKMLRENLGLLEGVATSNNIKISSYQLEIIELKAKLWDTFAEGMPE